MAWHVLYDTATGSALSICDDPAPAPSAGQAVKTYAQTARPDQGGVAWDATALDFLAIPAVVLVDRWQDLITNANATYAAFATAFNKLNATNQTTVQNAIIKLLGGRRMRQPTEAVEIDLPAGP